MPEATVLVVEDERPIAELLSRLVAECGAHAEIAYDGATALRMLLLTPPDLVLLDLIMPVMSGEEVLEAMADDPALADVPVIVITTREEMEPPPARPVLFLRKPFEPSDVRQMIRGALAGKASP
jgi:CheY-like chemotaxis protein